MAAVHITQTASAVSQSGAVPFRVHPVNGLEFLLITSNGTGRWIFPKGRVEPHAGLVRQAAIEAYEEAGVLGTVIETPVGKFLYEKQGTRFEVSVHLLRVDQVLREWPERFQRTRAWFPPEQALVMHNRPEANDVFRKAVEWVVETQGHLPGAGSG